MNDNMVIYNLAGASTGSGGGGSVDVIDSLDSTSTTDALSANQGRILKKLTDAMQAEVDELDSSVSGMQGQVNSIDTALTEEINTRETSDTAILKRLNTEIDERKTTDASLEAIIPQTTEMLKFVLSDGTIVEKTFYIV